jgi:hypothetical protein
MRYATGSPAVVALPGLGKPPVAAISPPATPLSVVDFRKANGEQRIANSEPRTPNTERRIPIIYFE